VLTAALECFLKGQALTAYPITIRYTCRAIQEQPNNSPVCAGFESYPTHSNDIGVECSSVITFYLEASFRYLVRVIVKLERWHQDMLSMMSLLVDTCKEVLACSQTLVMVLNASHLL
jgi:hypothetical protein